VNGYDITIGLEVHAQLLTESKIFCGCRARTVQEPNTNTCPVCMGMPGTLPVLNRKAVDYGIRLGLATGCRIAKKSIFARKNYFYPDLPKGYQITQHLTPLCAGGTLDIETASGAKSIRIMRIHMEEDAGKTIHGDREPYSYVDYNRSGVPLLEIVSMPDITSSEEAAVYLRETRKILMFLEICDGNMEEGSFRCDANISVKPAGSREYGIRTEIKNMNSFKNVQKALDFEVRRHIGILRSGGSIVQETRLWDAAAGATMSMRSKEESHDYRYFPEPDLVPVEVGEDWIEKIREDLPELPAHLRRRFQSQFGLPAYDAGVLTGSKALARYFEECVKLLDAPKEISNWIMTEVLHVINEQGIDISSFPISPERLTEMIGLVRQGVISVHIAKEVFSEMTSTGKSASEIVHEKNITQISDEEQIRGLAKTIVEANPDEAAKYRAGKTGLLGFFVGKLMSATEGKANPKLAGRIVKETLEQ